MVEQKRQALLFVHRLYSTDVSDDNGKNTLTEYFIPYSIDVLMENDLLPPEEEALLDDYVGNADIEKNITIDGIETTLDYDDGYFVNSGGTYLDISLFDYVADIQFVAKLAMTNGDFSQEVWNIGVYTALMSILFLQFKIDFSMLYHLISSSEGGNPPKNLADILYKIAQRSLPVENKFTREHIEKQIKLDRIGLLKQLTLEIYKEVQSRLISVYDQKSADGKYLAELHAAITQCDSLSGKFFGKNPQSCFCIAVNENSMFFSFSGKIIDNNSIDVVTKFLKKKFPDKTISHCSISEKTPCYGIKMDLGFIKFPLPIRYGNYLFYDIPFFYCFENIKHNDGLLFGCCERKIFEYTQNTKPLKVFCRWIPCEKCRDAVFEEVMRHKTFKFVALAENVKAMLKMVELYIASGTVRQTEFWNLEKHDQS